MFRTFAWTFDFTAKNWNMFGLTKEDWIILSLILAWYLAMEIQLKWIIYQAEQKVKRDEELAKKLRWEKFKKGKKGN